MSSVPQRDGPGRKLHPKLKPIPVGEPFERVRSGRIVVAAYQKSLHRRLTNPVTSESSEKVANTSSTCSLNILVRVVCPHHSSASFQ